MNPDCIDHILTGTERVFFNTHGYLVVENALDEAMRERLIAVMDRVDARERTEALAQGERAFVAVLQSDAALGRAAQQLT